MLPNARVSQEETKPDWMPLICDVNPKSYVTNKYIRSVTKQPQLSNFIRNRRLKWFGHLLPMDNGRISKRLYLWKPYHGKRRRGRPGTKWIDDTQRDLLNLRFGWSLEEAEVAAQDRND